MGVVDTLYLNSSFILHSFIATIGGFFGIFIIAPFFGQSVYKDFHCRIDPILFSCPIKKRNYLLGRWLGAGLSCLGIFSSIAIGLWLASLTPWVQKDLFMENKLLSYLHPYLISVIPNILIFGSFFFTLVCLFRKMAPVYVSGVILFIVYMISGELLNDIDNKALASLLDPFGMTAFSYLTEYWSIAEKNGNLVTLSHFIFTIACCG